MTEVMIPSGPLLLAALYDEADLSALGWQERASCQYADPDLWFPEKGTPARDAKAVCRSCEVRAECLGYAFEEDFTEGVWGGFSLGSAEIRRRLARKRRAGVPLADVIAEDDARFYARLDESAELAQERAA